MLLVLCRDPLEPNRPDRAFEAEVAAIERLGLPYVLIDHDALIQGETPARVVRRVQEQPQPVEAMYRGWMVTPPQYEVLHGLLAARNVKLLNDAEQYRHCHYLPECYPLIEALTPKSVWLTGDLGIDRIMAILAPFGDSPLILKDFVKSRKHEWAEACYIPSASDRQSVESVVGRFLELQGEDLAEGLVFREYIPFRPIGVHPKSKMPITEEYRIFWLDGEPLYCAPYWEEAVYEGEPSPLETLSVIASRVRSQFFTMDVARRQGGEWMIVELGDGQVSGLPRATDADPFYARLAACSPGSTPKG